jgi:hypothetical protein
MKIPFIFVGILEELLSCIKYESLIHPQCEKTKPVLTLIHNSHVTSWVCLVHVSGLNIYHVQFRSQKISLLCSNLDLTRIEVAC